ncbi:MULTISPECIES: DUF4190 domain-containing protein [unclassified Arthrobacter]|uniref:DUF4190 domain-containing protein n=1 Tax=unclassified Arthrobacter TaxID=235627 RepID=UPI00159E04E4|nr:MULTISPECIES: DUF4190 domain-containing protein [unclassified Arthrobacter]MCQ9162561.1 hypothetical protein [Arthrobacter sp. STN4]NVM98355.1 hypothetical protein [Arthrobacter sp. SDTb3-6]
MSNQPEQPQPYSGTPPAYGPPDYVAQPGRQPYGQQGYGQNPYGAPAQVQFSQPQYGPPAHYQGAPGYVDAGSGPRGLSLSSMIIGLASLFIAGWLIIPQIVGIVLGHIALSRESPQGRPFSITGLVTNYLALLIYLGIYAFLIYVVATFDGASTTGDTWSSAASRI